MSATSQEKALSLELRLARLFESRGYHVSHNVQRTGRSGATHQIDVFAEFSAPLHVSRVVIEAKSYAGSIDKDRVMKLMQIVDDLGLDRGILVTTSGFTPSVILTAKGHNVDLWDRDRLAAFIGEFEIGATEAGIGVKTQPGVGFTSSAEGTGAQAVQPSLDLEQARSQAEHAASARGRGFLGIGRVNEVLADLNLVHYPFWEVDLEFAMETIERRGLKKVSVEKHVPARISVDGMTGELVTVVDLTITYGFPHFLELTDDEMLLHRVLRGDGASHERLVAAARTPAHAAKALEKLGSRGMIAVEQGGAGKPYYRLTTEIPDPDSLLSLTYVYEITTLGEVPRSPIGQRVEAASIIHSLEGAWSKVRIRKVAPVYYPIYVAIFVRPDGSRLVEVIDGVTSLVSDVWSKRFSPRIEQVNLIRTLVSV